MTKSPDGNINFVEVKNGPNAGFTANQKVNYPLVDKGMPITPYGDKLLLTAPKMIGKPVDVNYQLIRYGTEIQK